MGKLRIGYGSEWHLLRIMGRQRSRFSESVLAATGGSSVEWLDFESKNGIDAEIKGVDFLPLDSPARTEWKTWWPQTGNVPNWDAVGLHKVGGTEEWLLVEAKAHVGELKQRTGAKGDGRKLIESRLTETQQAVGLSGDLVWTSPYYQYANRLAVLKFLFERGIPARLLFVYFTGDEHPGKACPETESEWKPALNTMKNTLGLTGSSELESRVHEVFVSVGGSSGGK